MAIAVFFSLFAAGGATAGSGKGQGGGKGGEQSQQGKGKQADAGEDDGDDGRTASRSSQKTPDRTPNDHPSGKDRTGAAGASGTQGNSTSDPDGMTNGGADKPGGDGGFDDDQDGNNGCGNDDDFEDDNNGWCGGKVKASNVDRDLLEDEEVVEQFDATVLGVSFDRKLTSTQDDGATQVRGAVFTRSAPGTLAATGAGRSLTALAALSLALVTAGLVMTMASNRPQLQPARVRSTD